MFSAGDDTVDFNSITAGSYPDGTQYDALAGNDDVTLANTAAAATAAGYVAGTVFNAGDGDDTVTGGDLDDEIHGGVGNDILIGGRGFNILRGGAGNDELIGSGTNTGGSDFNGVDYRDAVDGVRIDLSGGLNSGLSSATSVNAGDAAGIGTDILVNPEIAFGSAHDDIVEMDASFSGRFGTFFEFEGGGGDDVFNATGRGRVGYRDALDGVDVDLRDGTAESIGANDAAGIGEDLFSGVSSVRGSDFDDQLFGRDVGDRDEFRPGGGHDFIDGRGGLSDLLRYSSSTRDIVIDMGLDNQTGLGLATGEFGNDDEFISIEDLFINIENLRAGSGNDELSGDNNDNQIRGGGGNDLINGREGDDDLRGEDGDDNIQGQAGNDFISGGAGDDVIRGDSGDDVIDGGAGNDTIHGDGGVNYILPGSGDDMVYGGGGFVTVAYSTGNEDGPIRYEGATGGNAIPSGEALVTALNPGDTSIGTDRLIQVDGIAGTSFDDEFYGGAASENFSYSEGNDHIDGGGGQDFAAYGFHPNGGLNPHGIVVDMTGGAAGEGTVQVGVGGIGGTDTIIDVEFIFGTQNDDVFIGDASDSQFDGGAGGNDSFDGGSGGFDSVGYFSDATGPITYTGGTASNTINVGDAVITGDASIGTDTLTRIDGVSGTEFDDVFMGGDAGENLRGQGGSDTITGGGGKDFLAGDDPFFGPSGTDTFVYNAASDSAANTGNADVIDDFVSGEDKLDITFVSVNYLGEFNNFALAEGALSSVIGEAVLDIGLSRLYIDVDGSGTIDSADLEIELIGVTDLSTADFV
ncbi:MAG: hypothetical protein JXQ99_28175 [Hyphomicrobiaceae bacterium]